MVSCEELTVSFTGIMAFYFIKMFEKQQAIFNPLHRASIVPVFQKQMVNTDISITNYQSSSAINSFFTTLNLKPSYCQENLSTLKG
jgi:hypothetical protein